MTCPYLYVSIIIIIILLIDFKCLLFISVTDDISQNPFLKQYDKLNYDVRHLNERHLRVQRSIDNHLYFTFNSHGRYYLFFVLFSYLKRV